MLEASATRTSGKKLAERTRADLHRAIPLPASPHGPSGRGPEPLSSGRASQPRSALRASGLLARPSAQGRRRAAGISPAPGPGCADRGLWSYPCAKDAPRARSAAAMVAAVGGLRPSPPHAELTHRLGALICVNTRAMRSAIVQTSEPVSVEMPPSSWGLEGACTRLGHAS